jgi:hypothetical protein
VLTFQSKVHVGPPVRDDGMYAVERRRAGILHNVRKGGKLAG